MKTTRNNNQRSGFTLIEMVGVLAVIAVLAALLVPKIFAAIQESKYSNTIGSINSVKSATMNYFTKNSAFLVDEGTTKFDQRLITAGQLENPFTAKVGTAWECNAIAAGGSGVGENNRFSKLDGLNLAADGTVVQCKVTGVSGGDAWELSKRIDGADMSAADKTALDDKGRVIYAAPSETTGLTDVYFYIAHK